MNSIDLLAATLVDHEVDAPDVAQTYAGIQDALLQTSRHHGRSVAAGAGVAATILVATLAAAAVHPHRDRQPQTADPASSSTLSTPRAPEAGTAHRPASRLTRRAAPVTAATATTPRPDSRFPYRPGWLPPEAITHDVEADKSNLDLIGYQFGAIPDTVRGVTVWSLHEPSLPTSFRDGGTVTHTTINGRPAVQGWSPGSRTYTVVILRPGPWTMTVTAYGWDQTTARSYATHISRDIRYGSFPPPAVRR